MMRSDKNVLCSGETHEILCGSVGGYNDRNLSERPKHVGKTKRRPHSIAIGRHVACDTHIARIINHLPET